MCAIKRQCKERQIEKAEGKKNTRHVRRHNSQRQRERERERERGREREEMGVGGRKIFNTHQRLRVG